MSIVNNNLKVREVINQVVNDPDYKFVAHVPLISFHQLGLFFFSLILVFGGISVGLFYHIHFFLLYPVIILGVYVSFTTLHDATHRSLSSNRFLNDLLGTIAGNFLFLFNSTYFYRYVHMAHHRYVGDSELDPDELMVQLPIKYFPWGYICLFFYDFLILKWLFVKAWYRLPTKMRIVMLVTIFANVVFNTLILSSIYWYEYLVWFLIPSRIGLALVAYFFAHLPHPEGLQWDNYPFQSTYNITGNKILLKGLLGQAFHSMHHFLPHIPWYKYHKVWNLANDVFSGQNIPERKIFSKPDVNFKNTVKNNKNIDDGKKTIIAVVTSIKNVASHTKSFILSPLHDEEFPRFTAGSHINIFLPSGSVRSYSLLNPTYERDRYQIAVKMNVDGRGGSIEMHNEIKVGTQVKISLPKNNFVLYENVQKYILISGGIGITPLLSMAHRLTELNKKFEFHIFAKSFEQIPFQYELINWSFAPNIDIHLDKSYNSTSSYDKILAKPDNDTLVYVCGSERFNKSIIDTAIHLGWSKSQLKHELFYNNISSSSEPKDFNIVLKNSGKILEVDKNSTIIDTLLMNNIVADYSCLQGTCGTCICTVLEGEIDHRDAFLSSEEKLASDKMCLCVSRAKGDQIVLDL